MAAAAPFAMKVAPYAIGAIGSLFGKKQSGPSGAQKAAITGTQTAASQVGALAPPLLKTGAALTGEGRGYLREGANTLAPAAQYYRNILGSRQAANAALAPETATALEYYRGASNKAKRTMQGGARDTALAELDRQKVGQIAGMLPSARAAAAQGATSVGSAYGNLGGTSIYGGSSASNAGVSAGQSAAYINSGLFDQATKLREQEQAGGKSWGSFLYDLAASMPWGKGKVPLVNTQQNAPGTWGMIPVGNFPNPNASGRL